MEPDRDGAAGNRSRDTAQDAGEPVLPDSAIGPFIVHTTLEVGGMGVVLLAHDPALDRKVAIKATPTAPSTAPWRTPDWQLIRIDQRPQPRFS